MVPTLCRLDHLTSVPVIFALKINLRVSTTNHNEISWHRVAFRIMNKNIYYVCAMQLTSWVTKLIPQWFGGYGGLTCETAMCVGLALWRANVVIYTVSLPKTLSMVHSGRYQ